jgi:hypothetical protein
MKQLELEHIHIENYNLGARYCRKTLEKEYKIPWNAC